MNNLELYLDIKKQEMKDMRVFTINKFKKYWKESKKFTKEFNNMSDNDIAGYYLFRYSKVDEKIMIEAIENNIDNIGGAIWVLLDCKVNISEDVVNYCNRKHKERMKAYYELERSI